VIQKRNILNLGGSTSEVAGKRKPKAKEKNDEDENTEEVSDHTTTATSTDTTSSTSSTTQQSQPKKKDNNNIKKKEQQKKRVINFDESDFKEMKTSIPLWINNAIQYEANIVTDIYSYFFLHARPVKGGQSLDFFFKLIQTFYYFHQYIINFSK
jgi:hypothetical protein